ncbi:MAG: hypothetical protein JOZ47_22335 [Kutzneria sp.]|nr:hypothetical protein [Kutzneria sp.]MBV9847787.1 hypothetical protein [Kutzneria sp.]
MTETGTGLRQPVTGWRGDQSYFQFIDSHQFDVRLVEDVLRGRRAGVIFRGWADRREVADLVDRFWASPARRRRGETEISGYYVGAYHYHKPTGQYLDESREAMAAVRSVLGGRNDPWHRFEAALRQYLAGHGVRYRLASDGRRSACPALIRSWDGAGEFSLNPHEDASQCREPKQSDFEIQRVLRYSPCAVNLCLENGARGRLFYWNVQPDDETKRRHGSYYAGDPYPTDTLVGVEKVCVDVFPGDLYVFNGAHVHAVEKNLGRRTTVSCLMGFVDQNTVVTWT